VLYFVPWAGTRNLGSCFLNPETLLLAASRKRWEIDGFKRTYASAINSGMYNYLASRVCRAIRVRGNLMWAPKTAVFCRLKSWRAIVQSVTLASGLHALSSTSSAPPTVIISFSEQNELLTKYFAVHRQFISTPLLRTL
jgi:hypothetical protein